MSFLSTTVKMILDLWANHLDEFLINLNLDQAVCIWVKQIFIEKKHDLDQIAKKKILCLLTLCR